MAQSVAEQHLAASLVLFERLADECGRPACYESLRQLLDRPSPPPGEQRGLTLKYDFYLGRQQGRAWGVTINDAREVEGAAHARDVLRFSRSLGSGYRLGALQALAEKVRSADVSLTFATGFDEPKAAPRLKFYFQERSWSTGVLRWAQLGPLLARLVPDFDLPAFVPQMRAVGVVAIDLTASGGVAVKVYLGHKRLAALSAGAPSEVEHLASEMARACPLPDQFYYLTVRARSGQAASYSINKIYDVAALVDGGKTEDAWQDAARLFELTGDRTVFDRLRTLTGGLLSLPTATALEDGGKAADLYVAAISGAAPPPRIDLGGQP